MIISSLREPLSDATVQMLYETKTKTNVYWM